LAVLPPAVMLRATRRKGFYTWKILTKLEVEMDSGFVLGKMGQGRENVWSDLCFA